MTLCPPSGCLSKGGEIRILQEHLHSWAHSAWKTSVFKQSQDTGEGATSEIVSELGAGCDVSLRLCRVFGGRILGAPP